MPTFFASDKHRKRKISKDTTAYYPSAPSTGSSTRPPPPYTAYPTLVPTPTAASQQLVPYQQDQPSHTNLQRTNSCPIATSLPNLYDSIEDKFSDVISLIDEDSFHGNEHDLVITLPQPGSIRGGEPDRALVWHDTKHRPSRKNANNNSVNVFSKLQLYLNSRLPNSLPPLRLYMPTYPILCMAANHSADAYLSPQSSAERKDFVSANGRLGTKAMVIKSVPCDDKKTLVFAIRGTSMLSVRDWGVNLSTEPVSPAGFLDDAGNLCHSGFLRVAKAMVKPIANRLRSLLEENPNRTACSLLITGHSAGGAVAALLYSHMLSSTVRSELNILTNCFKRVHCITFGAPPVSLLPLQKPGSADGRLRKCLFHSFMNEGDPVVRAERAYIKSLLDLLATPNTPSAPTLPPRPNTMTTLGVLGASMTRLDLSHRQGNQNGALTSSSDRHLRHLKRRLWWDVPHATLSNAGRLVVLRVPPPQKGKPRDPDAVSAHIVSDEQLRQVIFGEPLMHSMEVYRRRIESLAVRAVTGRLND